MWTGLCLLQSGCPESALPDGVEPQAAPVPTSPCRLRRSLHSVQGEGGEQGRVDVMSISSARFALTLSPCGPRRRSLHSVHDEEKPFELELAWICDGSGREFKHVPADLAAAAERQAKAALADSDMCAPQVG